MFSEPPDIVRKTVQIADQNHVMIHQPDIREPGVRARIHHGHFGIGVFNSFSLLPEKILSANRPEGKCTGGPVIEVRNPLGA